MQDSTSLSLLSRNGGAALRCTRAFGTLPHLDPEGMPYGI